MATAPSHCRRIVLTHGRVDRLCGALGAPHRIPRRAVRHHFFPQAATGSAAKLPKINLPRSTSQAYVPGSSMSGAPPSVLFPYRYCEENVVHWVLRRPSTTAIAWCAELLIPCILESRQDGDEMWVVAASVASYKERLEPGPYVLLLFCKSAPSQRKPSSPRRQLQVLTRICLSPIPCPRPRSS